MSQSTITRVLRILAPRAWCASCRAGSPSACDTPRQPGADGAPVILPVLLVPMYADAPRCPRPVASEPETPAHQGFCAPRCICHALGVPGVQVPPRTPRDHLLMCCNVHRVPPWWALEREYGQVRDLGVQFGSRSRICNGSLDATARAPAMSAPWARHEPRVGQVADLDSGVQGPALEDFRASARASLRCASRSRRVRLGDRWRRRHGRGSSRACRRRARRRVVTGSTSRPGVRAGPALARLAEVRQHPAQAAVLRPGRLGEREPEVAVRVGPELQRPKAGRGQLGLDPARPELG